MHMNRDLTEIACIIDRSGSMDAIRTETIGGFNAFVEAQRQEQGIARLTLVLFDHEYLLIHQNIDLREVPPLTAENYVPRGTTAMLDAIGRTMDEIGKRLANTPENERPAKVIICILTDGLENASQHYNRSQIAERIRHQQEKYAWEFVFLAANQDAVATGAGLSIPATDSLSFSATSSGTFDANLRMTKWVSDKRKTIRSSDDGSS
jgi:uncharacterized protein YegL